MVKRQITIGAIISYIALGINIVLTLLYTPWMVAKIGQAGYGLYTLAISIIGVFMLDFGLSSTVTRFLSKYRAEDNQKRIGEFLATIFKLYFFIDCIILIILSIVYFCLGYIYQGLTVDELSQFKILFLIVAGFNLISFPATPLSGVLSAYEEFVPLKICDLINKLVSVLLVVLALLVGYGVVAVVVAHTISGLFTILLKIVIIKKKVNISFIWSTNDKMIMKEIFSFSIWAMIIGIAQRLIYNLAPSILAITSGSIAVSLYSPASSLGSYYYMVAVAINGLFLPTISKLVSMNEDEKILPLMIKVGRYQAGILGLILTGFICVGDIFILVWMGREFLPSYYCTILVMIPAYFEYSQQIANTAIVVKNKVKEQSILLMITSCLGCLLSGLLSYYWAEIGLCIALCIIGLMNVIGLNWIHYRKLGINIFTFYKNCYGRMSIPLIGTIALGRIFSIAIGGDTVFWLLIKGGVCATIYVTLLACFAITRLERKQIMGILKSKVRRVTR